MVNRSYKKRDVLERLYLDEGKTTYEIAELADCTQTTISKWLNEFCIETRRNTRPPELDDEYFLREKYHGQGLSMEAIGREVGCTGVAVSDAMERLGVEKRESGTGKKNPYPVLNDEEQMREWYCEQGLIFDEIAEKVGCERSTVGNALERLGIERRNGAPRMDPPISKDELEELYFDQLLSLEKIGNRFDVSHTTVRRWCDYYDIEIRSRGAMFTGEDHHLWKGGCHSYYGPTWYKQREKALERDEYQCRDCGMSVQEHLAEFDEDLHVHHIERFDENEPTEPQHELDNLLSLCQSCHLGKWEQADNPELAVELLPE